MKKRKKASEEPVVVAKPQPAAPVFPKTPRPVRLATLAAVTIAVVVTFLNTIPNELVYDDLLILRGNTAVRNPWDFWEIWGTPSWLPNRSGAIYRPVSVWSLAINYRANEWLGHPGMQRESYHVVNLVLHAAAAVALVLLLFELPIPATATVAAGLIFATHPIHTEAVAGITGRAEILAFLLGTLFLIGHWKRWSIYGCGALYLLAIWSKESAIAFLPVAIAMDALFRNRGERWPVPHYVAGAVTAVIWLGLWNDVLGDMARPNPFIDNPTVGVSTFLRFLTIASVQMEYLRLHVFPWPLSSDYSYNQMPIVNSIGNPRVLIFAAVAAIAAAAAWFLRQRAPAVPFAVLAYVLLFGVTSNVAIPVGTIMGERLAYAPSFAMCLLAGYGIWLLSQRVHRIAAVAVTVLITGVFSIASIRRNETWVTERVFFETQVRNAPRSAKAHYNLGFTLAKAGDDTGAIREYETSVQLFPFYPEPLFELGNARARTSAPAEKVIEAYRGAIEYDRGHRQSYEQLALYLLDRGRAGEAKPVIADLERLDPQYAPVAFLKARLQQAEMMASQGMIPPDVQAGIVAYASGQFAPAVAQLERALNAGTVPAHLRRTVLILLTKSHEALGATDRAAEYQRQVDAMGPPPAP